MPEAENVSVRRSRGPGPGLDTGGFDYLDDRHPGRDGRDELEDGVDDPELTLQLPRWLADVVQRRRDTFTSTDAVAGALLVLNLAVMALLVGRGALYLDDLRAQTATLNTSIAGFVLDPADGPFAPLPRLLDWVQATRFPLEHWPAVIAALAVRAALGIAFYRLLRRLVGPRPLVVLPLAVLLFTPALLTATAWERPAVTVLAATAAGVWAVDGFVAWRQQREPRSLVTVALATTVACCCHVSGVLVPVVLVALWLTVPGALIGRARVGRVGSVPAGLAASVVPVVAFLALYLTRSGAGAVPAAPHGPADVAAAVGRALLHQIVPGLLGGPYGWGHSRPYAGVMSPGTTLTVLFVAFAVLAVGVAARRSPGRTACAGAFAAIVLVGVAAVASVARTDAVGVLFGRADLVTVLLVPYLVLAAALAAFPATGDDEDDLPVGDAAVDDVPAVDRPVDDALASADRRAQESVADLPPALPPALPAAPGGPMTRRERRLAEAAAQLPPSSPTPPLSPARPAGPAPAATGPRAAARQAPNGPREIGTGGLILAVAVAAVVAGALTSTFTYAGSWWDNPTGLWLANVRSQLAGAEAYPRLLSTPLPTSVSPVAQTRIYPSDAPLLLLLRPDARFHDGDGQSRALNSLGLLNTPLTANLGQIGSTGCVGTIRSGGRSTGWLRLPQDVRYVEGAQIEIGFLVSGAGHVEVSMLTPNGRQLTPTRYGDAELTAGAHRLHVAVPYGQQVRSVRVSTTAAGNTCVTSVQVWWPYQ